MQPYLATYRLHTGQCGRLHILARSSCAAFQHALDALSHQDEPPAHLSVSRA